MKTTIGLLILLILFSLIGCGRSDNEIAAAEWIKNSKKPVYCYVVVSGDLGTKYTLIDAETKVYSTGFVWMNLPDTIKVQP